MYVSGSFKHQIGADIDQSPRSLIFLSISICFLINEMKLNDMSLPLLKNQAFIFSLHNTSWNILSYQNVHADVPLVASLL